MPETPKSFEGWWATTTFRSLCADHTSRAIEESIHEGIAREAWNAAIASLAPQAAPGSEDERDAALELFVTERESIAAEWGVDNAKLSPLALRGIDAEANQRIRIRLLRLCAAARQAASPEKEKLEVAYTKVLKTRNDLYDAIMDIQDWPDDSRVAAALDAIDEDLSGYGDSIDTLTDSLPPAIARLRSQDGNQEGR